VAAKSSARAVLNQAAIGTAFAFIVLVALRLFKPDINFGSAFLSKPLEVEPSPSYECQAKTGDVVSAQFTVRNCLSENLTILGLHTPGGCVAPLDSYPMELSPGELRKIKINFTVGNPSSNGKYTRIVDLFLNHEAAVPSLNFEARVSANQLIDARKKFL
jgi:hypothetical protein